MMRGDDRPAEPTVVARAPSDDDSDSDGEFEFPSVSRDAAAAAQVDELFAGGRIRAFYPVFGRVLDEREPPRAPLGRLFQLEKARTSSVASTSSTSSSSSAVDLDGASPDTYCLWAPGSSPASSPARLQRKSGSTGSMSRWRRIGELVVGRSRSDGRDKFLFLSAPPSPARNDRAAFSKPSANKKQHQHARGGSDAIDTLAAARRMSYGGSGAANKLTGGSSPAARRTFLPYRQHLVGLFASQHHHPF